MRLTAVFVGTPVPLPPEGQLSAIVKHPVTGPVQVGPTGLAGDAPPSSRFSSVMVISCPLTVATTCPWGAVSPPPNMPQPLMAMQASSAAP